MIYVALAAMAFSSGGQAAQVYKWVDDQGVTHFDAQPPAGRQTQQIDLQKAPPAPARENSRSASDAQAEQRSVDTEVKKKVAQDQSRLAESCKTLRTNLAQLQNNPRVREQVEGGLKRLSEEERKDRVAETQKAIEEYCVD
jgi:hypothetical protein